MALPGRVGRFPGAGLVESKLRSGVRWIGPVSRAKTAAFYRQADLLVFPTFSDGFGLTQLEAQAWKLPIIATKFCGDVVQDRSVGF